VPFANPLSVYAGGYEDLVDCRVVVITAGTAQKPGETRLALLERNAAIMKDIVGQVLTYAPDTILLIVSNPVDVMTHLAARFAAEYRVPTNRVIGSGTTLDTARFRALLGQHLGVDSRHIHGYVLGEHGDSEVLTWSLVTVGGIPLEEFYQNFAQRLSDETKEQISYQVRDAAYKIIEGKGATYYGVGSALARIVEVIINDQRSILTLCTPVEEVAGINDVTLSLPNLISGEGIVATLRHPLSPDEEDQLRNSAKIIRAAIDEYESKGL
jgi:L-lactate dehydrogenase